MIWLEFHPLQEVTHHIFFHGFKGKLITFLFLYENILRISNPKCPKKFLKFVTLFIQVNSFQKAPFDHHFMKKFNRLFYTAVLQHVEFSFKSFDEMVKFMFSKKATKIDEIFTVDLTVTTYRQIDGEDFVIFCGLLRKREL